MVNPFDVILERINGLEDLIMTQSMATTKEPPAEIIDRNELQKRLGLSEVSIMNWEKKGKIPNFRIGGAVRYNWPKVIEALESKGGKK
ncbi:hypothetical protein [Flavihumibacter sp. CACIAM 22H1]|uniref:helix-turn-helix transcriptional regulator n=1 Tax=Flavihumibacter sp. CACIAM 22H1 TaxID=1812911 RepID=UPI0007A8279E|nr:hypothetical protein [Flavihumibacter sp. CACIAM 22H1]KYP16628.1 MAG: hypothetical protein A1D16_09455 [Flavihumibacter sp. CACIAM 22H1]